MGLELFPEDPELLCRNGMLLNSGGDLSGAEAAYLEVITAHISDHLSSVDPGIMSYKARHNLRLVYDAMERCDLAEVQWRNSSADNSPYVPSRRALVDLLVRQGRVQSAQVEIDCMS